MLKVSREGVSDTKRSSKSLSIKGAYHIGIETEWSTLPEIQKFSQKGFEQTLRIWCGTIAKEMKVNPAMTLLIVKKDIAF